MYVSIYTKKQANIRIFLDNTNMCSLYITYDNYKRAQCV